MTSAHHELSGLRVVIDRIAPESAAMTSSGNLLMDGTNWSDWEVQMNILMSICNIDKYVKGYIDCPNPMEDEVGVNNWDHNNKYRAWPSTQPP